MAKNWIAGAVKNKGGLHRSLGVPEGQKIPQKALASALAGNYGSKAAKQARLARTLGKMNKG